MAAKPKTVVIVGIVAVAIAAFASYSLYNYLKGQEARVKEAVATGKVVVAAEEIPAGATINPVHVKTADWPQANVPSGSFGSTEQVTGRMALDRYLPGEPITETKLVPKEGLGGILSYKIPEGHRAMTVAVDQVAGVAGFITPGSKVDVVLTTTPPDQKDPISKIVLQDVPVLATGQVLEQQKDGKPLVVPTVTMDVTPQDAEKLAIASTQGRLQLVLRRAGDVEPAITSGETVAKVMKGTGSAKESQSVTTSRRPAKPVQRVAKEEKTEKPIAVNVEIYRGDKKSVETFTTGKQ
jgi:pilus assembly protein CpaB